MKIQCYVIVDTAREDIVRHRHSQVPRVYSQDDAMSVVASTMSPERYEVCEAYLVVLGKGKEVMLPAIAVYMCSQALNRLPVQVCHASLPDDERLRFHLWVRTWMHWVQRTTWN